VYDVKWSPVHPALFACVDGAGMLDLWNINTDSETPVERVSVSTTSALSAVRWSPDGRNLVTGDSRGRLVVHDVAADCALPARDEWTRLEYTISDMSDDLAHSPTTTSG
jgi:dynein intermediate chain